MEPSYFIENRYSFVVDALPYTQNKQYEVDTPETAFERDIQNQLATANRLLCIGKFSQALAKYKHLRGLISNVLYANITVISGTHINWGAFATTQLPQVVINKTADILKNIPVPDSTVPALFRSSSATLPAHIGRRYDRYSGIGIIDQEYKLSEQFENVKSRVDKKDYTGAIKILQQTYRKTRDTGLRGAILHDIAIIQERTGSRRSAINSMNKSSKALAAAKQYEYQARTLNSLAGMYARNNAVKEAETRLAEASQIQTKHNIFAISTGENKTGNISIANIRTGTKTPTPVVAKAALKTVSSTSRAVAKKQVAVKQVASDATALKYEPARLMVSDYFMARETQKTFSVYGDNAKAYKVKLDGNARTNLNQFYNTLSTTRDIGILMGYLTNPTVTIGYLTHIYCWVIPMAIGDCLAGIGSYEEAETEYLSTLKYKYINKVVESVNLWLRLAELYLDWGDRLYRLARNDVSEYKYAKKKYEYILKLNNSIALSSPLYKSAAFIPMRARVKKAITSLFVSRTSIVENPRILIVLHRARMQLNKISNKLNYIGLGVYIPPFSFEYLQNLARYFAQHAAQVEQSYIQYKSTGENEQLREQQMSQQVEVAEASIELEMRGLDEAREGIDVANASKNYADVQRNNAISAKNDFASVRWELLELDTLNAWANAAAVGADDEVRMNINNRTYYSANNKPRSHVIHDLTAKRTRISHNLEANRLQREVNSATAYREIARQQVQQAEARAAIASQRVEIATLQAQHARENVEFLSNREFSSAMWYNLAREAQRLTGRYLDMAIEIAILMEKAYEAETGKDLRKIKFEYGKQQLNGMLGADALLLDIDYFSLDYARTRAKKAQLKQSISLADKYPMAFDRLLKTGTTFFETTLEQFDRQYPGFYLQKVKQVEVVFVGLNGSEGAHGTLRNIGISQFRRKNGNIVNQAYPADVMPLSEYDIRQDYIVFQLESKDLRLFENNGIATMWQLDLPLSSNTFDLRQILDIHIVLNYDGFFDSTLESDIISTLPRKGESSRGLSLRLYAPDELFYLRNQGTAELELTDNMFPANEIDHKLIDYTIEARGKNVSGLKLHVRFDHLNKSHLFTLDSDGKTDISKFVAPKNKKLLGKWIFTINPDDNPGFDFSELEDIAVFIEYKFKYKS